MGDEGNDRDDDILARLMEQTRERLQAPTASDTWPAITDKICSRKKIEKPLNITSYNTAVLGVAWFWPLLISKEKLIAVQNIQSHIRSTFTVQPYLSEELATLVFVLPNMMVLAAALAPLTVYEAIEPLLQVCEAKLIYLKGKKANVDTTRVTSILQRETALTPADNALVREQRSQTPRPSQQERQDRLQGGHGGQGHRKRGRR